MNWDLILTVLALSSIVILISPILIAMLLAYHKARMKMDLESISQHRELFKDKDDVDWVRLFEEENK
jgi:hypothetical protein